MNIKKLRSKLGYTQTEFSKRYNIPFRTIQNWESGVRIPPKYIIDFLNERVNKDLINSKTYILPKYDPKKKELPKRRDFINAYSWIKAINNEFDNKAVFALDEALICDGYFNGRNDEYIVWVYGDDSLADYNGVVVIGNNIDNNYICEKNGIRYTNFNRTIIDALDNINLLDTQGITEAISKYYYQHNENLDNIYISPEYLEQYNNIVNDAIEYYDN